MKEQKLTKADLAHFTGTEQWHHYPILRNPHYTDGIWYMAENGEAYWLIDAIAFVQLNSVIGHEELQSWMFKVNLEQSTVILTCDDATGRILNKTPLWKGSGLSI